MKFSELQKELKVANTTKAVADIREKLGKDISEEDLAQLLETAKNTQEELSDDMLENISGGIERGYIPQYEVIKDYYKEKGANLAFILCIYYIPSPSCHDIIKIIEEELEHEGWNK